MLTTGSDNYIDDRLTRLEKQRQPYVLIYTSGANDLATHVDPPYEMDEPYPSALHTDLKRDVESRKRNIQRRQANGIDNSQSNLPLFERYQYLTPGKLTSSLRSKHTTATVADVRRIGLFMGLTVSLLLFIIGYVAVSAIAGLEVSYMAFSKEMGPQAQKGKQQ